MAINYALVEDVTKVGLQKWKNNPIKKPALGWLFILLRIR